MRRKSMLLLTAFLSIASGRAPVLAAGHEEVTVIPVGRTGVERGRHEVVYRLPSGPSGPLHQPVVFIAAQPWAPVEKLPPEKGTNEPPKEHQVPGTLSFTIGDQELPDWVLRPHRTAYVVGLDVIRANRAYHAGNLAVTINLDSEAEGVNVSILGMPDPLLLDDGTASNRCGPLADYQAAAADPEVRAYFAAMIDQIAGQQANAQRGFDTLRSAKNPNVARLARRALRMLAYQLRDHKLTGNFMEHYRWALYLQFCGLFDAAFREFDECRILEPDHVESQFRAGECLDRINAGFFKHLFYMERAGEAGKVTTPNVWSTLVAIQSSGGAAELSAKNVSDIKDHWLFAEKMLWAASGGVLATSTVFHEIGQTARQPYTTYPGNVRGPADDIVEQRGWFDGVISVQPDRKGKDAPRVAVVGGDAGPNGAALSSVTPDATWPDHLEALYRQLCWAAETLMCTAF